MSVHRQNGYQQNSEDISSGCHILDCFNSTSLHQQIPGRRPKGRNRHLHVYLLDSVCQQCCDTVSIPRLQSIFLFHDRQKWTPRQIYDMGETAPDYAKDIGSEHYVHSHVVFEQSVFEVCWSTFLQHSKIDDFSFYSSVH